MEIVAAGIPAAAAWVQMSWSATVGLKKTWAKAVCCCGSLTTLARSALKLEERPGYLERQVGGGGGEGRKGGLRGRDLLGGEAHDAGLAGLGEGTAATVAGWIEASDGVSVGRPARKRA